MRLLDNIPFLIFVCVINLIPGIYGAIIDATGIARVITGTNLWFFFYPLPGCYLSGIRERSLSMNPYGQRKQCPKSMSETALVMTQQKLPLKTSIT